jgi:hypothetical protein
MLVNFSNIMYCMVSCLSTQHRVLQRTVMDQIVAQLIECGRNIGRLFRWTHDGGASFLRKQRRNVQLANATQIVGGDIVQFLE